MIISKKHVKFRLELSRNKKGEKEYRTIIENKKFRVKEEIRK